MASQPSNAHEEDINAEDIQDKNPDHESIASSSRQPDRPGSEPEQSNAAKSLMAIFAPRKDAEGALLESQDEYVPLQDLDSRKESPKRDYEVPPDAFSQTRRGISELELSGINDLEEGLTVTSNLALYDSELTNQAATTTFLSSRSWDPRHALQQLANSSSPQSAERFRSQTVPTLNTFKGVFFPSIQQIVGIIMFIRLPLIIGIAGIGSTLIIIFMSVLCTFLTSTSMAAIATNGRLASGGAYYMISRSMGKEFGISIGLSLYFATAAGCAVYLLGTIEILVLYTIPEMSINLPGADSRIYSTVLLLILAFFVTFGQRYTRKIAIVFILCVTVAFIAIYSGIFASNRPGLPLDQITGFPGNFDENFSPGYDKKNLLNQVLVEKFTFIDLFAIFFPCVTGIIAGTHRSGELANPARSIPIGTLSAIGTSSLVYLTLTLLLGTVCTGEYLRTVNPKFALPITGVAWPDKAVVSVGAISAGLGAGLQCFVGASIILNAMVRDEIVDFLKPLKKLYKDRPVRVFFVTYFIAQCIIFIGSVDIVATLTTMMFLLTYAFLNASTALLSILKYPNWRPTWAFHHWSLSLLGAIISVSYMFVIDWVFAIISLAIALTLYKYIEYRGARVSWGDGITALNLSVAQRQLMSLEQMSAGIQARNWRPQIITFIDLNENFELRCKSLLKFLGHLRKAGGLAIVAAAVKGNISDLIATKKTHELRMKLDNYLKEHSIEGFSQLIVSEDLEKAKLTTLQTAGIGVLRPNTVLLQYPNRWLEKTAQQLDDFLQFIQAIISMELVLMLLKSNEHPSKFPGNNSPSFTENDTIDVYWIMHDGGVLTLLPYILKKHRVWRKARLRIFCIAQANDDAELMQKNLESSLKQFRINAEAHVIELGEHDISEFTYEKTMTMELRSELLNEMKKTKAHDVLITAPKANTHRKKPDKKKAEFMNTSVKLNGVFKEYSSKSAIIFCSLPVPFKGQSALDYFQYLDVLTSDLQRVVFVKGTGMEVVTTYF